jgi:glycine dehydrogenase subunit 1
VQQPNFFGAIEDVRAIADVAHASGALMVLISADPLAFGVLAPPGECDVDIFAGEGQGIGNPLNFGGPYLGIIATRQSYVRRMPGRLVGATSDVDGNRGYVLTLQTREQHIRREKATSNICTNEALNALAASVYLSLIGKDGARRVAELCLRKAHYLKDRIAAIPGYSIAFGSPTFHEFVVATPAPAATIARRLAKQGYLAGVPLGRFHRGMSHRLLVCVTESRTKDEMDRFADALQHAASKSRARRGTLARAAGA